MINFRKIGVHVRKPVDHLVTTSARRTCIEPRLRIRFRRIRSLCQLTTLIQLYHMAHDNVIYHINLLTCDRAVVLSFLLPV